MIFGYNMSKNDYSLQGGVKPKPLANKVHNSYIEVEEK